MQRFANILLQAEPASGMEDAVETIRRTTFQGPLTIPQAIAAGVGLALLCAATLWVESRFTGRRAALIFWPMRAVVLALVLWMLLEPSHTTVERRTERRSLAVVADVSGSMEIVDAADTANDRLWHCAVQEPGGQLVSLCDRLAVAANEAHARVRAAQELSERSQVAGPVRRHLTAGQRAGGRMRELLAQIAPEAATLIPDAGRQVQSLLASVRDDVLPGLADLLDQDAVSAPQARAATLQALASKLDGGRKLARKLSTAALAADLAVAGPSVAVQVPVPQSRREKVQQLLETAESTWLRTAEQDARIERWAMQDDVQSVAKGAWRQAGQAAGAAPGAQDQSPPITNLTALLEQVGRSAAGNQLEGVLLFSDGRHNAPGARDPLEVAGALGSLPVYVVPIGDDRLIRDVLVHHLEAPRAVAKDDTIVFDALITAIDCAGERVQVELVARDDVSGEQVVDQQEFTPDVPRMDQSMAFKTRRETTGRFKYAVRVSPIPDEASDENNVQTVSVDVVETDMKVLLADDAPRWEYRFLSRLFERDEHVEFDQLLLQPSPVGTGDLAEAARLPQDVSGWARYRVVLLGDIPPLQLPRAAQEGLREFVTERGGTLILTAGTRAMPAAYVRQPLGELLPVVATAPTAEGRSFSVAVTTEGRSSAAIQIADSSFESERVWRDAYRFAPLPWLSEYRQPKPTAHTLLAAVDMQAGGAGSEQEAVLCWQTIGRGRVVYFSAPDSYRLRARHGDRYHHAFWGQLLRWSIAPDLAAGSKTVRIRTDKQRYDATEPVQVTVDLHDVNGEPVQRAKVRATVRQFEQIAAQIDLEADPQAPGQYVGRFDQLPDGALTVQPAGEDVSMLLQSESYTGDVSAPVLIMRQTNAEMNDTRSNPALLARIAELTGGQVIPPTAVSEVAQLVNLSPEVTETESHQPLWNNWWCLAIITGCLVGEWIARKRMGLL